jgi:hypothetical protein
MLIERMGHDLPAAFRSPVANRIADFVWTVERNSANPWRRAFPDATSVIPA